MTVEVLYFASLRDAAGREREAVGLPAGGLASLYDGLRERYRFALGREQVRVALNGEFVAWNATVRDGDQVALLPPVSGG
jgi:molybdopterin synthase sulfur carrier subunit